MGIHFIYSEVVQVNTRHQRTTGITRQKQPGHSDYVTES